MLVNHLEIPEDLPVLIAGPTASGKSDLALEIAERQGRAIVNADALQVFANWRVLTARPDQVDMKRIPHHLYGHISGDTSYSVGQWLRDIRAVFASDNRPIIVGGTGLNFTALTEGLVDIPATKPETRRQADDLLTKEGLLALIAGIDVETLKRIDQNNPMRVQRAWEVQQSTSRGLASWQDDTPAPLIALQNATPILLDADRKWLNTRIAQRFDYMLENGALSEAQENQKAWSPSLPSAKAIGAAQLMAHLKGEMSLDQVREAVTIATRQYAKRQRSWFRARMKDWQIITLP
ncbi:MAG: tRNA (adenosine(37)-N6)-dimethylallyltransferase MiaA [Paracoccaceae bacterium]